MYGRFMSIQYDFRSIHDGRLFLGDSCGIVFIVTMRFVCIWISLCLRAESSANIRQFVFMRNGMPVKKEGSFGYGTYESSKRGLGRDIGRPVERIFLL